jgi:uncharacterized membrane protein
MFNQAILLAIVTAFLMALGQIFFKKAAIFYTNYEGSNFIMKYVSNPWFVVAVIIFGLATIVWVIALSKANLVSLYPITSLAYVIVPVASYFLFSEKLSAVNMLGIVFIIIGVILISQIK